MNEEAKVQEVWALPTGALEILGYYASSVRPEVLQLCKKLLTVCGAEYLGLL